MELREQEMSSAIFGEQKNLTVPLQSSDHGNSDSPPEVKHKIIEGLSLMDDIIASEIRRLDLLRQYKLGLMQQIFPLAGETTPRLRFPEFNDAGEWESTTLGEIGQFMSGGNPSFSVSGYWGGTISWFTSADIKERKLSKSKRTITSEGLKHSAANLLPAGTILLATGANIGDAGINKYPCVASKRLKSFVVNQHEVNLFWYYWLQYNKYQLTKRLKLSTVTGSSEAELISMPIFRPKKREQQKIADCLDTMDNLIETQISRIRTLRQFKLGLSQKLSPTLD